MDDADTIDAILGVQADPQKAARAKDNPIPLPDGRLHRRQVKRRVFHRAERTKAAIEALPGLPEPGETWHVLMAGAYDGWDLVDAILTHAAPATITELRLGTLGFNSSNATRLIELLENGKVGRCTMLVSTYYASDPKESETCYRLSIELPERGGWYCVCRSHAKVVAAKLSDGRCFVIESSANLRSCRNIEQFTISQDEGLYAFHSQWMEDVFHAETERQRQQQQG